MKKCFITGAAGFIGSQIAYHLYKKGYEVTLLDNFSYGKEDNLIFEDYDFRQEIIRGDIRDKALINKLFEKKKFDYVYHIAAITPLPDCQTNPAEAVDVNVTGTVAILEASRVYGAEKIIFASTSAVYENNTDFPSVEDNVVPPSLIYPSTKYTAEQFCRAYADTYNMNIVCLRFANVYGPHLDCLRTQPPVTGYMIRELFFQRNPVLHGDGTQRRDFVYVEDLIRLAELVIQKGTGFDIVNVSTGTTVSVNELMDTVIRLMNVHDYPPEYREVAHFWHNYPNLYGGAYPIREEALANEVTKYTELSNAHAFEKYGWKPLTDLETGVQNTIDFSLKILEKSIQDN
ncbi:MAG: NAD-dependent epimerase/dehydratase family protein [Oscillospiraceae bacterium]|jgi:UDP-glucose 4-epimerase|nr:NAD-dependent epimerase/dehydratase family protein [Oscillospiraceae bacterium]